MKKWIVKQLINRKWIKEALYEAVYKEYVEDIRKKYSDVQKELDSTKTKLTTALSSLEIEIKENKNIKDSLLKAFPIFTSFDSLIKGLIKCASVITPLFPKEEPKEEPKKKRKYTKKKK